MDSNNASQSHKKNFYSKNIKANQQALENLHTVCKANNGNLDLWKFFESVTNVYKEKTMKKHAELKEQGLVDAELPEDYIFNKITSEEYEKSMKRDIPDSDIFTDSDIFVKSDHGHDINDNL